MSFDIKLPQINAATEKEQLSQIRRYLYGLAEQLNFALNAVETGKNVNVINNSVNSAAASALVTEDSEQLPSNFNAIKSLIIKSADVVEAYTAAINRKMAEKYVAQSEFGTYTEETTKTITETAKSTEQLIKNVQTIQSDIDGIPDTVWEVDAHIDIGVIDDTVVPPRYGFSIGERTTKNGKEVFNQYARFTSDKLSFYDGSGTEVAHVSNTKLYITNAEITEKLKVGGFEIDASKGFTLKWVGKT